MPLEPSVTHIADLNPAWPAPADAKSDGDDHIRNQKKALLNDLAGFTGAVLVTGTDGGAANVYTVTPTTPQQLPAYGLRMGVVFSPAATNTGACTLNISGLGAKPLRAVDGAELVSGDLAQGCVYPAIYNGTEFRLPGPTKNYIDQKAFITALPGQFGSAGKFLTTDGLNASWAIPMQIQRSVRTGNVQLVASDKGALADITSGTFTQTFDAPASLGAGWYCYISNSGTGDITIPASDGVTNWVMYSGEVRLFLSDGSALSSKIVSPFTRTFSVSANFVRPPGYVSFDIELFGAGGGGAGGGNSQGGGAGAGGGYFRRTLLATDLAATNAVAIGAGGTGGAAIAGSSTGANGVAGGSTSLAGLIVTGGAGGSAASAAGGTYLSDANYYVGAVGAASSTAGANGSGKSFAGSSGGSGASPTSTAGGIGGARGVASGGGGAGGASGIAGTNGAAFAGGGGGGGGSAVTLNGGNGGNGGTASGGGGGGAANASTYTPGTGGRGGDGLAIIRGV